MRFQARRSREEEACAAALGELDKGREQVGLKKIYTLEF